MKKDWKYIFYLVIVIGLYVAVKLFETKQNDWSITLAHEDKEPYGTFALNQLLPSYFKNQTIINSYKTLYELKDSLKPGANLVILATSFKAGKADAESLLRYAENGGTVFISAHYFGDTFADTLGLATNDSFFNNPTVFNSDSSWLYFSNPEFDSTQLFHFKNDNIQHYFSKLDSTKATVIAKNDKQQPVSIRIAKGKGQIILNCTPMVFTNIYLLAGSNHEFIANTFSYLPEREIYRTEYYHVGRMEASTPLRFILTTEPLTWAYYITVISILLFMIFEAKRKQRIIPVIKPLANSTLEFVSTIGNLYFYKGNHKNLAEKKIQFFLEYVRSTYFLPTTNLNDVFIANLAKKSGNTEEITKSLVSRIQNILSRESIEDDELVDLSERLESFRKNS